jgi:hypothetical protein
MEIKDIPTIAPWLAGLPLFPKLIFSIVVIAIAAFLLAIVWIKPPPNDATRAILDGCYRRALMTRTQAQTDISAMFHSVSESRNLVQTNLMSMKFSDERKLGARLVGILHEIENLRNPPPATNGDFAKIDALKLQALHDFRELAKLNGTTYELPNIGKLGEAVYFTEAEADSPLTKEEIETGNKLPDFIST